jgi:2,4-dienoyl-CoA reductase-like NADH-dependent reductase (Old Yellow Enzyme family)
MASGIVVLTKDDANLIGISIGGGVPLCPHVYMVQVFDGTPASQDQTLESGDRIVAVNNVDVDGRTKLEVARLIQSAGVRSCSISKYYFLKNATFFK